MAELSAHERLFAIGDVHGDLDAVLRIVHGLELVDGDGRWTGGSARVVFIGDLNDRGPESVNVMHFVMSLQEQAAARDGLVVALLGNHGVLAASGDYRYIRGCEAIALERWWWDDVNGLDAVFRGESRYARWLRSRPTMRQIGDTLFVHAGIGSWALDYSPDGLNELLRGWVSHFQGVSDAPDESTYGLTQDDAESPLWTKRLNVGALGADDGYGSLLDRVLSRHSAARLVVGHCPTRALDYRIAYPHPEFGDRVALIDAGISSAMNGRLSALQINGDVLTPRYFERGEAELELTQRIRAACTAERDALNAA